MNQAHSYYLFLNWRITGLQNFVVFCQTSTWISHRYTYIPFLLNLLPILLPTPPLKVDTDPLFEFPEPNSKSPSAVYFTHGNVSFHATLSIYLTLSSPLPMSTIYSLCLFLHCGPVNKILQYHFSKFCIYAFSSVQFSSVAQLCLALCDPMNRSMPGLLVHHQLLEFTQNHVHQVGDAIQPSHPLSSPSPPAPNPSQHQGLFQWVNSSHEVAKVMEFQLQHQSFQWTPRTDLL